MKPRASARAVGTCARRNHRGSRFHEQFVFGEALALSPRDDLPDHVSPSRCDGNPHPFTIVAADLKAVGAPAPIRFIDHNAAVMAPLDTAGVALEQQAVDLHDPVDSFVIGRL